MCAAEVTSFDSLPGHLGRMRVPGQTYAVFVYDGHVSGIGKCWDEIMEWLAGSEYESTHTPDFERYDQDFNSITATGRVEIWLGVTPR